MWGRVLPSALTPLSRAFERMSAKWAPSSGDLIFVVHAPIGEIDILKRHAVNRRAFGGCG